MVPPHYLIREKRSSKFRKCILLWDGLNKKECIFLWDGGSIYVFWSHIHPWNTLALGNHERVTFNMVIKLYICLCPLSIHMLSCPLYLQERVFRFYLWLGYFSTTCGMSLKMFQAFNLNIVLSFVIFWQSRNIDFTFGNEYILVSTFLV